MSQSPLECCSVTLSYVNPSSLDGSPRRPSLDPQETTSHPDRSLSGKPLSQRLASDLTFRHSGWCHRRNRIFRALHSVYGTSDRLARFEACGMNAWVLADPASDHRYRVVADYCHDRWCQPCANARSRTIAENLRKKVQDHPHRFITLTLRSDDEPLAALLKRLYTSFAKLRRSVLWSHTIRGGAAFLELKYGHANSRWHPHLHIIADGKFLPQKALSATWLKITGDSYIVDVRLIQGHEDTIRYVTKYASKPLSPTFADHHDLLCEAMLACRGRRLCLTFGTWAGTRLTDVHDDTAWQPVAPLWEIRKRAMAGDGHSIRLLNFLRRQDPWLPRPPPEPNLWDQ